MTIDDPLTLVYKGHETGEHAPGVKDSSVIYEVGHNLLLAHAEAVSLYRQKYKSTQNGLSITLDILRT